MISLYAPTDFSTLTDWKRILGDFEQRPRQKREPLRLGVFFQGLIEDVALSMGFQEAQDRCLEQEDVRHWDVWKTDDPAVWLHVGWNPIDPMPRAFIVADTPF